MNNNSLKLQECVQNTLANKGNKEENLEKQGRQKDHDEKHPGPQNIGREKGQMHGEKIDKPVISKEEDCDESSRKSAERDTSPGSKTTEDAQQKNGRTDAKDGKKSNSDRGKLKDNNRSSSPESSQKQPKTIKVANVKDEGFSRTSASSEAPNGKRKRPNEQKDVAVKFHRDPENKEHSKHKKSKTKHVEQERKPEEPPLSFESYLNYDVTVLKRKVRSGVKPPKKNVEKEPAKDMRQDAIRSKAASFIASEKQVSSTKTWKIAAVDRCGLT